MTDEPQKDEVQSFFRSRSPKELKKLLELASAMENDNDEIAKDEFNKLITSLKNSKDKK